MRLPLAVIVGLLLSGCHRKPASFRELADGFVYESLSLSPVGATSVGYHQHHGVPLDELLDDYSPEAIASQRRFYEEFRQLLKASVDPAQLSPEDRADHDLIHDQISLALLELDTIQNYRHNPTTYVELVGNALFTPSLVEYAPKLDRYQHIIARMRRVPALLEQAKKNLVSAPPIWTQVAQEENDGNIELVDKTLRSGVPSVLRADYQRQAGPVLAALRQFNTYLRDTLSTKPYDWQLGKEKYAAKFRYALATDQTPEQVLAAAEAELKSIRERMSVVAKQVGGKGATLNATVRPVLDRIAARHATPDTYFADAERDLAESRQFVKDKNILPLPTRSNLKIIETPEFMRGIYAVGGFVQAPALQPELGAFYWLTPIPKTWPAGRIESKLREYNYYGLKLLTIHEAMPGHYVQFEYANDVQPQTRRVLRGVFGSGSYVEGWAVYVSEAVLDAGYLENSPELRLSFLKHQLRVLANAILDIRLQTMGMTDEQALNLMTQDTFQENEEATAKLRRAKLSSAQLPLYYVGYRDWRRLRDREREAKGSAFSLSEFHARALREGALPLSVLSRLLTGHSL